ncbi:unnamed protein product [Heterobilharzia americana]|nr:unnamed protein product [Heterobilharzia americana]
MSINIETVRKNKKSHSKTAKSENHLTKVKYTLEIQPPLIHSNDPKEFILDVIGSQDKWLSKVKFTDHVAGSQSSTTQIEQANVGNIQYLRITPYVENISSRYLMEKLVVTQILETKEIYCLLKSPQFYTLLPPKLRNRPMKEHLLLTQYNCEDVGKTEEVELSLPFANKYTFNKLAYGNFESPTSYSLEFSNVTVSLVSK